MDLLKKFAKREDGGADQLIIAAILIVVGIGIALMFGDKIKGMVVSLLSDPDLPEVSDYYSGAGNSESGNGKNTADKPFVKGNTYSCAEIDENKYEFTDEKGNKIVLEYVDFEFDDSGESYIYKDKDGKRYRFVSINSTLYKFLSYD